METVTPCLCGCGEPAQYAARHVKSTLRAPDRLMKWEERDMGYDTPCHIWTGNIFRRENRPGEYGVVYQAGRYQRAHRLIWEMQIGPIPAGHQIHHLCLVTLCVNTDHLIPLSPSEHIRMERAKLTPALVRYIRESHATGQDIADELHVSTSLVSQVRTGQLWADVE